MRLTQLQIKNFRNLKETQLTPVQGVNLISGDNASGKTSLLEAIYYLSHVRSFRTQHVTDLILRQSPYLQLVANIETSDEIIIPVGIRRSRNKSEIRVNKQPVKRVSDIAAQFPVLAIHPDSYKLITGSPCQLWNNEIHTMAHYIDQLRQQYFNKLSPYFRQLTQLFFTDDNVSIEYKRGWGIDCQLLELLEDNLQKERMKGYTQYGPHRAEITIKVNGQSAQTCISRGQQKLLVALMRLAQAMQFTENSEKSCVLLYDDLAAELDLNHRKLILSVLSKMNIQLFLTAIEKEQIDLSSWKIKKMFHVKHGNVKSIN